MEKGKDQESIQSSTTPEASEKLTTISHPCARGRCRHNGQRMNTAFLKAQDVTDITFQHTYDPFLCSKGSCKILKVYKSK